MKSKTGEDGSCQTAQVGPGERLRMIGFEFGFALAVIEIVSFKKQKISSQ